MFLDAKGKLSWKQPSPAAFDEYVADPSKPVPYIGRVIPTTVLNTYMTEDQRFASMRPDVLVYKTEPLDHDVNVFGPIIGRSESVDHRHRFRFRGQSDRRLPGRLSQLRRSRAGSRSAPAPRYLSSDGRLSTA